MDNAKEFPFDFTSDQKRRYSRNIMLPEIGKVGQARLISSRVLVIGAGALGSICAMYLAASGIGNITIVDFDTIDISNLQRQLSFSSTDCGKSKAEITKERIAAINPEVKVTVANTMFNRKNAKELLDGVDLAIEGSDNPATKYLLSEKCEELGIPYTLGGVSGFEGQVMSWKPGATSYRDIFPVPAADGEYLPCSLGGVPGPLTGIVGSIQAMEAIKMICNIGTPLYNTLLLIDALKGKTIHIPT